MSCHEKIGPNATEGKVHSACLNLRMDRATLNEWVKREYPVVSKEDLWYQMDFQQVHRSFRYGSG